MSEQAMIYEVALLHSIVGFLQGKRTTMGTGGNPYPGAVGNSAFGAAWVHLNYGKH
jgi:hypothetical protein